MNFELVPIGDNNAVFEEIKLVAKTLSARTDEKEFVCKIGPRETGYRLPQRLILDGGVTVEIVRETVLAGSFWIGVKGDLAN